MKILYLIDTLETGGTERSIIEISQRLTHFEPVICHLYPGNELVPLCTTMGIRVISLNIDARFAWVKAVQLVVQVIQQEKPDILHTSLFRADVVGRIAGRITGTPVIGSLVGEPYSRTRKQTFHLPARLRLEVLQQLDKYTAKLVCQFIAVSNATKQANRKILDIPEEKVSVIYRGRNPDPFTSVSQEETSQLRAALALPPSAPVFLSVGRLINSKGHEELVHAISIVRQNYPDARLLLAGEGPNRTRLEAEINQRGLRESVQLLGLRQDIPALLHLADAFIFPSHHEGLPGSLVEAMLAARPIVASNIQVHQEIISHNESGLLVPVKNVHTLAGAMVQILQDVRFGQCIGKQAQRVALERFDIERVVQQYECLYKSLSQPVD